MKKRELKEVREKTNAQLTKDVEKLQKEYLEVRTKLVVGEEKNLKKAKHIRRDIAQILGIIGEPGRDKKVKKTK